MQALNKIIVGNGGQGDLLVSASINSDMKGLGVDANCFTFTVNRMTV